MATVTALPGGGNWSSSGTWDVHVPTAADDVVLASTSGNVTIDAAAVCRSLDASAYTGTLTHNSFTLSIGDATAGAGNVALKLGSGMTYTRTSATASAISFVSTSATVQTIDYGGKTMANQTFGAQGKWQLSSGFTGASSSTTINHNAGTIDINGQAVSTGVWAGSNSTTRTLALTGGSITCSGTGNAFNYNTSTNLTISNSTGTVTLTGSGATLFLGGKAWTNTDFVLSGGGTQTVNAGTATATVNSLSRSAGTNLTFAGTAGVIIGTFTVTGPRTVTFVAGQTYTVTTWAANGTAGNLVTLASATPGTRYTLSKSSGTVSASFLSITDSAATGGATWNASSSTNGGNNTGWTFLLTDSMSGTLTASGSSSESRTDSGSRSGTVTLSGSLSRVYADSGTAAISLSGTGTDGETGAGSGAATIVLAGSATDSYTAAGSGQGTLTLDGSGSDFSLLLIDLSGDFHVCHQITIDGDFLVLQRDSIPIDLDGDFRVQGVPASLTLDGDFASLRFRGARHRNRRTL